MDFQATFSNQSGQAKTLDIKDGFSLQDAYNVVANDDFAPTQITLEAINMNSSDSNVEPEKQVETAYDLIGRHSSNDIIDKYKISSDELAILLEEGTNHELEHTSSYLIAMKIAQDHLYEDLMYYSKLKEAMLARGAAVEMSKDKPQYDNNNKFNDGGQFPSEGEIVEIKDIDYDMMSYFSRTNKKLLVTLQNGDKVKSTVGKFYGDLIFSGDFPENLKHTHYSIQKKSFLQVEIIEDDESKQNPDIRFDKGGYVSEEVLIENNIGKIDDIYVFSEDDKPVKSLGEFTLKGFGKFVMKDLAAELYDDYKIRLRSDFAIMLQDDVIKPSIKVAQMKDNEIELLAIIYNALVTDEDSVSYVYNEDGEVVGKFTDEDFAEDMVNNNDGYYSEVRVEEVSTPETILAMQFYFNKHDMNFVSSLLEKQSTHKFKYGGKL